MMYFDGALDKNAFRKLSDHSLLNGHREKSTFSNALPMVNYYILARQVYFGTLYGQQKQQNLASSSYFFL